MLNRNIILLFLKVLLFSHISYAQQDITINGFIKNKTTGEVLIGANIWLEGSSIGTSTNEYGYYSLQIPLQKKNTVIFSYVGFEDFEKEINSSEDLTIDVELSSSSLQEIVVTAQKESIASQGLNQLTIPIQQLASIPSIGGETDIMKALALFPGINIGQEGTSSLYIRGGTPDQNLILLDGIPVYNASHIGGFFSTFNADAINNIDVIRGGIPAQYGGRLSSVIDITMREGNTEEFKGSIGTGILTSHVLLEGPFKNKKGSYLFASRISYLGLVNLLKEKKKSDYYFDYWLYDINFKTNFNLKKGKLYFSFYNNHDVGDILSRDVIYVADSIQYLFEADDQIQWGNTTISTRYALPLTSKIFAKFLLGYTAYHYKLNHQEEETNFTSLGKIISNDTYNNQSGVKDWIGRIDLDYNIHPKHYLKFGLGTTLHEFSTFSSFGEASEFDRQTKHHVTEYFSYIQDKFQFSNALSATLGLRWEAFQIEKKFYQKIEPRFSLKYQATKKATYTASFSNTQQYLHLLQNNGFGLPNDIWVPATENVPPQSAYQFTVGSSFELAKKLNLTTETYYKKTKDVIEYKTGLDEEIYNQIGDWESLVEPNGTGESFGVENLLQKDYGKFKGYLSYTLSWNFRQFDNINEGKKYPFTYDRRHDIAIVLSYALSKKISFTGSWVYQTGTAVTLPVASSPLPDAGLNFVNNPLRSDYFVYDGKNNRRLPAYHRTDIGMEYKRTTKRDNSIIWKFSIYNLFNIRNPSYLKVTGGGYTYATIDGVGEFQAFNHEIKQVSLFSFIPGISFEYKF